MDGTRQPKQLFKFYLDQQIQTRDERPLFFRRNMRWRVNSKEYATPFSKKGLLRGYIKYGIFTYMAWHYTKALFAPSHHHGHHDAHHGASGHHDSHHGAADHSHDAHAATGDHDHGHGAAQADHGHDDHHAPKSDNGHAKHH